MSQNTRLIRTILYAYVDKNITAKMKFPTRSVAIHPNLKLPILT